MRRMKRMTRKEKDELFAVYQTLVLEEHNANKSIGFDRTDPRNMYLDGYLDALGKALDLLGNFMGLGVKFDSEGKAING